jgi:hypothetical protein
VCHANADCKSGSCVCRSGFSGNGTTCTDVDECADQNGGCHAHAECKDFTGYRTCACNDTDGWYGSGIACSDLRAPTLTIELVGNALNITDYADLGAFSKVVALSPLLTISAADNSGAATVTCTAPLGPGGAPVALPLSVNSFPTSIVDTEFPVGTTMVTCIAADAESNRSPPEVFAVVVGCVSGDPIYSLMPGTGCIRELAVVQAEQGANDGSPGCHYKDARQLPPDSVVNIPPSPNQVLPFRVRRSSIRQTGTSSTDGSAAPRRSGSSATAAAGTAPALTPFTACATALDPP